MTLPTHLVAGPRQTVTRVQHPTLGPGIAVYRNGPAFFQADGAAPITLREIIDGRAGVDGSFLTLAPADPTMPAIEVRVLDAGEFHRRRWSPMLGAGWLVVERNMGKGWPHRFDSDDGRVVRFHVVEMHIGTPSYAARCKRTTKVIPETPEERHWITYTWKDGSVVGFRDSPPDPGPAPPDPDAPPKATKAQLAMFSGGKKP